MQTASEVAKAEGDLVVSDWAGLEIRQDWLVVPTQLAGTDPTSVVGYQADRVRVMVTSLTL